MIHHVIKRHWSSYGRLGFLLSVVGVLLAIDMLADLAFLYKLWPLLITMLGIGFIGIHVKRSRKEVVYVGVGVYLIGFSALALFCNLTSWATLSSLWPLFIGLMGMSLLFGYFIANHRSALLLIGLLFISLSLVFFFVFSLNYRLWWTVFILSGVSFLVFDWVRRSK